MKLIITAEIDDEEIGGIAPESIIAQLRHDLGTFEFWTADSEDGFGLFGVKVTVNDAAREVRHHSSDDMSGLTEFSETFEPVAVAIRPDGSVDAYGYIAVIDQR